MSIVANLSITAVEGHYPFFFIALVSSAACYLYNYTHRPPNVPSIHVLTSLSPSDRQRHTYAIGKTGAGKSTIEFIPIKR